ncbi:hypothetical protein KY285_023625 [Solanum tuberosum]|nr:hypothetical protein KY289_023956 [Solanum tuberosum]KAH0675824.1 hypothetical protein KY285_023625 [Solanum tuberosum]
MFDLEKETSRAIAWISFPALPPNFFIKEDVFSLADVVGKPLHVDLAMKNQTRPSCARVKVEVDLLGEFPKRINVGVRKQFGEVMEKWIRIKYDYVPKYCKNCCIQGHDEQECYVIHLELYPKKEGNDVADCARGKGDKDNKRPEEHPVERREIVQNIDEDVFKEQKKKKGGWERKMGQNKVLQVWNPKQSQKEKEDGITGNQFDALGRKGYRDNNVGNEVGSTKKWVEEVFREKEKIKESCGIKKKRDQSGSRKGDTVNEVEALDTSLTVDKANNEQVESEDRGSKVGNIGGGVPERMENKGSSSFFEEGINDLQEHSNEEIQHRGDTEKDGEVNANIDTIARDGDLSPRQINNLKSGVKKTVPYLPLQVKTRSNKGILEEFLNDWESIILEYQVG